MNGNGQGTCYLIHFARSIGDPTNPRGQAQHYLGHAEDLEARLDAHANGNGARLMAVIQGLGVEWQLVRTWPGDYEAEKRLKRHHNSPRFCPICNPDRWLKAKLEAERYVVRRRTKTGEVVTQVAMFAQQTHTAGGISPGFAIILLGVSRLNVDGLD